MQLAKRVGLNVAPVRLAKSLGKDVLLIERFDRQPIPQGRTRQALVSSLTIIELDESEARYASYQDLAEIIRHRFTHPKKTLEELFSRLIFNILCGNTDDHARNQAAFWDGHSLSLTPVYDICLQGRTGGEATQAMKITGSKSFAS
jgi:serine/threonine-protein kinase HipA